eukprot:1003754-Alexandrium_andersonii.AAC.1
MPRITFRAILAAFERLREDVKTYMRSVSMELCVFRTAEVNTFSQVLGDMLATAALQPWRKRPRWTAEDMQLPAVDYGTIPEITTKPE